MMITTTPREADPAAKQESNSVHNIEKSYSKPSSYITSTSRSRLQDPRIVRVSRAFGGKDRHSKVCTVKGLRDRRVRLSVPTAIQLYDLQERLGLNQPSKVVDWLLNEAKHDIDELPPLQMPLENFGQSNDDQLYNTKDAVKMINSVSWEPSFGNLDKYKEVIGRDHVSVDHKANWNHGNEEERGGGGGGGREEDVLRNRLFPGSNYYQSSIPGLLNNVVPYNSIYRLDPSIFSLSHFAPQTEDQPNNFNIVPMPSLSLQPGSQVLVCPTVTTQQRYFPSHVETNPADFESKQINHVQMLSSTSQNPSNNPNSLKAFQLSMSPNLLQYSQNSIGSRSSTDDHEFSPK